MFRRSVSDRLCRRISTAVQIKRNSPPTATVETPRPLCLRTHNLLIKYPLLHWQTTASNVLFYNTKKQAAPKHHLLFICFVFCRQSNYSEIFVTTPAPTVRPPSRIAKRVPSSIAIGAINSTDKFTLSPGITISVPSGRLMIPVTSVVRK